MPGSLRSKAHISLLLSGTGNCIHLASLQVDAVAPTLPCPADLCSLDLSDNRFTSLPDAISVATGLTSLCLENNRQLALGEADREALLALHNLQQLNLRSIQAADPALLKELRARMPRLSILASLPSEEA